MTKKLRALHGDVFDVIDRSDPAQLAPLVWNKSVVAHSVLDELAGQIGAALDRLASAVGLKRQIQDDAGQSDAA